MRILIVIPARFNSTRLPGKPLKKICGKELIIRVIEACAPLLRKNIKIVVATDDKKIFNLVNFFKFEALMTSKKCSTGTDRVADVSKKIKADIYINVQGDEPLINADDIKKIIKAKIKFSKHVICGYSNLRNDESVDNKNIPKVVMNKKSELMYISRSAIPSLKGKKLKNLNFSNKYAYMFQ